MFVPETSARTAPVGFVSFFAAESFFPLQPKRASIHTAAAADLITECLVTVNSLNDVGIIPWKLSHTPQFFQEISGLGQHPVKGRIRDLGDQPEVRSELVFSGLIFYQADNQIRGDRGLFVEGYDQPLAVEFGFTDQVFFEEKSQLHELQQILYRKGRFAVSVDQF